MESVETPMAKSAKRFRNKIIKAWLSESEYQILLDKCHYTGLGISAFIRKQITDGCIIHYEPFDIKKICDELNEIKFSVDKIASKIDARGTILESDNDALRQQYENLIELYLNKVLGAD